MQKNWQVLKPRTDQILGLTDALGISSILAHLLVNRKIETPEEAERFLNPRLSDLHDPFLFKDMAKAVERIKGAISRKEKILIYGDYDVDGITGMAILIRTLRKLGTKVDFYIPHRIEEGYGMSEEGMGFAIENRINLVITVDCGITNAKEIEELKKKGIDVIITDHHEPDLEHLPMSAFCVLDSYYPGETYPDKDLSGAGVAFKLSQAIFSDFSGSEEMLDLVALGTISDVCRLRGENRILVKYGLAKIGQNPKAGVKALLEVAEMNKRAISTHDVSFILGPRINAMGRLDSAELALKLFLTDSLSEALEMAKVLDHTNRRRQDIEDQIYKAAINRIDKEINFSQNYAIVLEDRSWHQGVIGIVASRLTQRYMRPVILFSLKDKLARGSARVNLEKIHLFRILSKCKNWINSFGGHKSACGLEVRQDLLPQFKDKLNQAIKETTDETAFLSVLNIDRELSFDFLGPDLLAELERLAPFGEGNPLPTFVSRKLRLKNIIANRNDKLKDGFLVWVSDGRFTYQAKGRDFQAWATLINPREEFDLVYHPRLLNQRGESSICLNILDFRSSA